MKKPQVRLSSRCLCIERSRPSSISDDYLPDGFYVLCTHTDHGSQRSTNILERFFVSFHKVPHVPGRTPNLTQIPTDVKLYSLPGLFRIALGQVERAVNRSVDDFTSGKHKESLQMFYNRAVSRETVDMARWVAKTFCDAVRTAFGK